jgi:hypothetical protein
VSTSRPSENTGARPRTAAGIETAAVADDDIAPQAARSIPNGALVPADCGCGCGGDKATGSEGCTCSSRATKVQFVYAIGELDVSFVSQARRDSVWRAINRNVKGKAGQKQINNVSLLQLFRDDPHYAQSVVWTLNRNDVAMYAILPTGAFAAEGYELLVKEWSDSDVDYISLPGVLAGQIPLYDGQVVDAVIPDIRGIYAWNSKAYREALIERWRGSAPRIPDEQFDRELNRFFGKIQFSVRNRGLLPGERALNAAAINALNFSDVIAEAGAEGLTLRDVGVEPSPLSRPGSQYYDVLLTFFDPKDRQGRASLRARFTVDVSDTVPVIIGDPVLWNEY